MQAGGAEAAIAAKVDAGSALALEESAESAAELDDVGAEEFGFCDAADVVFAENGGFQHEFRG